VQESAALVLESRCPAEFRRETLTCLSFSNPEGIDQLVLVCLIRVGTKLCRTAALSLPFPGLVSEIRAHV